MPSDQKILTVLSSQHISNVGELLLTAPLSLMLMSDSGLDEVESLLDRVSQSIMPKSKTALELYLQREGEERFLSIGLQPLDQVLQGGFPLGVISEICG